MSAPCPRRKRGRAKLRTRPAPAAKGTRFDRLFRVLDRQEVLSLGDAFAELSAPRTKGEVFIPAHRGGAHVGKDDVRVDFPVRRNNDRTPART